jgi:hypothetical protein
VTATAAEASAEWQISILGSRLVAVDRRSPIGRQLSAKADNHASFTQLLSRMRRGVFTHGGPEALRYGEANNYPVPPRERATAQGNPWMPGDRVGAFSHLDEIYPTRRVARASEPWAFARSDALPQPLADLLAEHLSRHPRLLGQSMTKSITGLLVGLALADGVLKSVDDAAEKYVAGLKESEYGRTPLRALLQMSSGIDFGEERDGAFSARPTVVGLSARQAVGAAGD